MHHHEQQQRTRGGEMLMSELDREVYDDTSPTRMPAQSRRQEIVTNLLAGLTTSFAAIALGAAFGVASGRGALVGILSAGSIALVTAVLGGTRVQCSGPTAPMTTVSTVFVAYSRQELLQPGTLSAEAWGEHSPENCTDAAGAFTAEHCPLPDYFCNIVMLIGAGLIGLMGVCRVGPLISHVPNVVISGFMNGIAVQIWAKQVALLVGGNAMQGSALLNWPVTFSTTALCFLLPRILRVLLPAKVAKSTPSTLIAIALMTLVCVPLDDCLLGDYTVDSVRCIEKTQLGATISSFADVSHLISTQFPVPALWTSEMVLLALPFALQLAVLCYLDTLLTSLVVDKLIQERDKSDEVTKQGQGAGGAGARQRDRGGVRGAAGGTGHHPVRADFEGGRHDAARRHGGGCLRDDRNAHLPKFC
jgi:SulP family sulfate permease